MDNYYPGADPDIPGPGAYDVQSSEAAYKKYGFLSHSERFKSEKAPDDRKSTLTDGTGRSVSRTGSLSRRAPGPAMAAIRVEESRLKREIEHYQKTLYDLQTSTTRETRVLKDKVQQAEDKVKDLLRERTDIKKRLVQREVDLRAKERDRDLIAAQLEKQQAATHVANPKTEKQLKENAEQASAMCAKLKATLDKARASSENDKRRLRQLEHQLRKLEQERDTVETELKQVSDADYPRQMAKAQRELRLQEEHYREKARKLGVELQDAKDMASRYMNELGEAAVHNTALENELRLAMEREQGKATDSGQQLDAAMAQLSATQTRLSELERLARQRALESDRVLDAANEHVLELKGEIERLETEREQVQREMQGKIRELTHDYKSAKREFESSVKGADDERTRRLLDTQGRLERATKETLDLKTEVSELRGILLKKEMAWKDRQIELDGDLQAAASDYEALQTQMNEQHQKFDARVQTADEQARKKERLWSAERTSILEKLDSAHKDGFRLRDALDALQKEAAQIKADCDADLRRMGQELTDMQAEADDRTARWEAERKDMARAHVDEQAELKDEYAKLEQEMQDERYTLESQLDEARDELAEYKNEFAKLEQQMQDAQYALGSQLDEARNEISGLKGAQQEQLAVYESQLADASEALEKQVLAKHVLETQLAERDIMVSKASDRLESERREADALRAENEDLSDRVQELSDANDDLGSRVHELSDANDNLADTCARLQDKVEELVYETTHAAENNEVLEHYTGLMQQLADKHHAEKAQWTADRTSMQSRLDRYRYRESTWAIQDQHLRHLLDIKEDARVHIIGEARRLFDELQDEMVVNDTQADACASLLDDMQGLHVTPDTSTSELEHELRGVREYTRRVFLESIQRASIAQASRARVDNEVQELRFMRVQGQIVETVSEMSGQHKAERARLESDLNSARSDYRGLHETAAANRTAFEAQVTELETKIHELAKSTASSPNVARLESDNAALAARVRQLTELSSDLESRLEVFEYAAEDDRSETERQLQLLSSRNTHMTRVLEQCEVNMATHVSDINAMGQRIAELESERAILAEQTQFQTTWLKENYAKAYQDLDAVLSHSGHNNLRQRIRYVEGLKTQILALKKEGFECSRERDRFKHSVGLLKSELDAYKEVNDVEEFRASRSAFARRNTLGRGETRARLAKKGAAVVGRALDDALRTQHMSIVDE
ncbi:hypothetical protein LPJ62_001183 [Coemansia sp. RSA 2167]|nr:hypothetical protein LPJ62_001183 [Coemansia sp. RSA 2167]KAJ2155094.1 hypothetical protein J3F82_000668 [Coemansia sp. RSA 637]